MISKIAHIGGIQTYRYTMSSRLRLKSRINFTLKSAVIRVFVSRPFNGTYVGMLFFSKKGLKHL